jgi:hypothetical protein
MPAYGGRRFPATAMLAQAFSAPDFFAVQVAM